MTSPTATAAATDVQPRKPSPTSVNDSPATTSSATTSSVPVEIDSGRVTVAKAQSSNFWSEIAIDFVVMSVAMPRARNSPARVAMNGWMSK